ncbi:MAG: alpha/beta hydrolase-fold protein [Gemmataceae bacterium]
MKHFTLAGRHYSVVEPASPGPWPVVMMLHGAGGTPTWTVRETNWDRHAQQEQFLLVVPEAMRRDPTHPPSFLHNPPVWNDGLRDGFPMRPHADDVTFLNEVLDAVASHYPIRHDQVYLTGFSNGAAMTFRLAAEASHRFAAIGPVAGYCYVEPHLARPVPTLFMVGRLDPLVPLEGGEIKTPWGRQRIVRVSVADTLQRWSQALGGLPSPVTMERADQVTIEEYPGPVPFLSYTIDDLGHHWPGGRGELKRSIAGPPSDRVDACSVLWGFFRDQRIA